MTHTVRTLPSREWIMEPQPGLRPARDMCVRSTRPGSLARKDSMFTGLLLGWVAFVFIAYDLSSDTFNVTKTVVLGSVVLITSAVLARYTGYLLARPLQLLERGIASVREGRLEPVQVSRIGDEIEYLGDSL